MVSHQQDQADHHFYLFYEERCSFMPYMGSIMSIRCCGVPSVYHTPYGRRTVHIPFKGVTVVRRENSLEQS